MYAAGVYISGLNNIRKNKYGIHMDEHNRSRVTERSTVKTTS